MDVIMHLFLLLLQEAVNIVKVQQLHRVSYILDH